MGRAKLAVFDMDGTLFDTAEVNYRSYAAAAEKIGFFIDREKFKEVFVGRNYRDFLPLFGISKEEDLEFVHKEKKMLYPQYLRYARKNQALFDIINTLKTEYVVVLATTASRANAMDILECFHVARFFDYMITQEDSKELKPNPECYLKAMELAGIGPEKTIVFEDSDVGIIAGQASGASVYKVCGF